jgi:bifunctional UDP-N-acetylglucosamine pyrophosphorylase / glucosamine-1-phosphate N-acetyltransferase
MFSYIIYLVKKIFEKNCFYNSYFLIRKGINLLDPKTVYIEKTVKISHKNVLIEDNVTIKGNSTICSNVKLLKGTYIVDSFIKEGSIVGPFVYISNSDIGSNNLIGPFSFLRPNTKSASFVKIGAFVETKNSFIDEKSKLPHLSYLGDASVGKNVNLGAGLITCNYDGVKKSKTLIGDNVFIGSDVQLIAPLKIASNSYVAAGSTINKDVNEYDLAISRTKQVNKENYAKKIKGGK